MIDKTDIVELTSRTVSFIGFHMKPYTIGLMQEFAVANTNNGLFKFW